ncbi:protoporphyrinogen oxidase HemJ [Glycocaulis abyssi]|uniref:Protoporphyrinogen IX oxidase n=1 Tax=Glycocaulis abyssi TaxID=1433403 RepID=A0ABV9NGF5_9PROT
MDFLLPFYDVFKALHIVSVIFWMAGMLYLPRLFVYHHTAIAGGELETALLTQEKNLNRIIMGPALIAVWVFAILMIAANPALFSQGWFHAKLALVIALSGVHGFYAASAKRFAKGERPRSEKFWRIMNEVPAIAAIAIVLLAILKPFA